MKDKKKKKELKKINLDGYSILHFDLSKLEQEWVEQPKLFFVYSEKLADARYHLDNMKSRLEVYEAETALEIRSSPNKYGYTEKAPTETAIKQIIVAKKKHQKGEELIRTAKHAVDVLDGMVKSLDQRKKALEKAVDLYGQQYFSMPREPDSVSGFDHDSKKKAARKPRKKLK